MCRHVHVPWFGSLLIALAAEIVTAQDRPYDGLQAGQDAYELAETQRQQNITGQASLNDSIQTWRNQPGRVVYYRPPYYNRPGGGAMRANVTFGTTWGGGIGGYSGYGYSSVYDNYEESSYGGFQNYYVTPVVPGIGYYRNGRYGAMYRPGYTVVTPSYPTPLVRQPVGQWQGQTGPNRWESHPVYGDEDEPVYNEPARSNEPIVKPKIIVPPPREY